MKMKPNSEWCQMRDLITSQSDDSSPVQTTASLGWFVDRRSKALHMATDFIKAAKRIYGEDAMVEVRAYCHEPSAGCLYDVDLLRSEGLLNEFSEVQELSKAIWRQAGTVRIGIRPGKNDTAQWAQMDVMPRRMTREVFYYVQGSGAGQVIRAALEP